MAHTWGISGPTFLVLYTVLLLVTGLIVVLGRRRRTAAAPAPVGELELDTYDLAMLNGGEQLALATAVASLWEIGVVTVHKGRLEVVQPPDGTVAPVERAVADVVHGASSTRLPAILSKVDVQHPALLAVRERLVSHGLLYTPAQRADLRRPALWFLPVLALGVARLAAGIANGKPVGFLIALLALTAVLALCAAFAVPSGTPNGRRLLDRARKAGTPEELSSKGLAYKTAVGGLGVLWGSAAELAGALGVRRETAAASTGSVASSCGAASSCGGGGCSGGGCGGGGGGCGG